MIATMQEHVAGKYTWTNARGMACLQNSQAQCWRAIAEHLQQKAQERGELVVRGNDNACALHHLHSVHHFLQSIHSAVSKLAQIA